MYINYQVPNIFYEEEPNILIKQNIINCYLPDVKTNRERKLI